MELKIDSPDKAKTFCAIWGSLRCITSVVCLEPQDGQLFVQALDDCKACLVEVHIPADWFSHYRIGEDSEQISVSTEVLQKALSTRAADQTVSLRSDDDTLNLELAGGSSACCKEFGLQRIDIDRTDVQVSQQPHLLRIVVPATRMQSIVKQLMLFGEQVEITRPVIKECETYADDDGADATFEPDELLPMSEESDVLHLSAQSEDGSMAAKLSGADVDLDKSECRVGQQELLLERYGLANLDKALSLAKFSDSADVRLPGEGHPCHLSLDLGGGVRLDYYVAPRLGE